MKPRIRKVIQGVHMGLGHDGLALLLKKEAEIDVHKLQDGDLVLCLNKHGDKMKVIGCHGLIVGYLKMPERQRIMQEALQYLPQTFGGTGFNYAAAERTALNQRFNSYAPAKKKTLSVVA